MVGLLFFLILQPSYSQTVNVKSITETLNSVNRPLIPACSSPSATGTPHNRAVQWSLSHIQNIQAVPEADRGSLYHLVETFYCRLTNWQSYRPFYDRLFSRPEIARAYPDALPSDQLDQGLFIRVRNPKEKITENSPLAPLTGKTIEEVFGYEGDMRIFHELPAVGSRQLMIVPAAYFKNQTTGRYNTAYHEFGHVLHLSLLSENEYTQVETLYSQALARNSFLDDYAAGSSSEYIAQGLEAFMSETKPGETWKYHKHTKADLLKNDPDLYNLIAQIIENSPEGKCTPQAP